MQASNGAFGYEISARNNSTGESEVLGFTTSTTYTVDKQEYDSTYFVRTKYQNNPITASLGVTVDVQGDISTIKPENYSISISEKTTTLTVDPNSTVTYDMSTDLDSISVLDKNQKDITSKCVITASKSCSNDGSCLISGNTVTINKAGTYKINYTVTYKDIELGIIQKSIIVNENKSN